MVIIETPLFTQQIAELVSDDDYAAFQESLVADPAQGDLIKGGGGIRKIRLRLPGRGKSGGARVIYFWVKDGKRIYLLLAYAKNVSSNLTPAQVKILKDLVKELQ